MHIKKRHIPLALNEAADLFQQGALKQAYPLLDAILKADPRQPEALHLMGLLEARQGMFARAEEYLCRAAKISPDMPEYHNSLGVVLRKQNKLGDAERSYRRCLKLDPDHVEALDNLGTLLRHDKRPEEATPFCRRAVRLRPDDQKLIANLAGSLAEQGAVIEPKQLFEQLLLGTIDRQIRKMALTGLMSIASNEGNAHEYVRLHQQMINSIDPGYSLSSYLFHLNYLDTIDQPGLGRQHRLFADRMMQNISVTGIRKNVVNGDKQPLRIGYLSPDMVKGSAGRLFEPVIKFHDKDQVYTVIYDLHTKGTEPLEGIRTSCNLWHDCRKKSATELAQLIIDDGIDILVDLAGHCAENQLPLFAQRFAPVQVSWLGYFNTTGLRQMDWLISDPYSTPPGEEPCYTEKIWRMPYYRFPVLLKPNACESRSERQAGKVTFVSNNNLLKVTPTVLETWAKILNRLPDSVLAIRWTTLASDEVKLLLLKRFESAGGNSTQLLLLDPIGDHEKFMASYSDVDIMLDTFPFSGGVTSLDALSQGVPVVTLAGDRMAGRQTQAFLELAGHTELIASSLDEYVRIAVDLANNPERLAHLRRTLRDDLAQSPLCDVARFTRDLETVYRTIWEKSCQSSSEV